MVDIITIFYQTFNNINVTSFTSCYHWGIFKLYSICIFFSGVYIMNCIKENSSHFCQSIKALFKCYFTIACHYICLQSPPNSSIAFTLQFLFKRKSTTSFLPYLQALNNGVGRLVSDWSTL
jgi:hypothetical protein